MLPRYLLGRIQCSELTWYLLDGHLRSGNNSKILSPCLILIIFCEIIYCKLVIPVKICICKQILGQQINIHIDI